MCDSRSHGVAFGTLTATLSMFTLPFTTVNAADVYSQKHVDIRVSPYLRRTFAAGYIGDYSATTHLQPAPPPAL